MATKIYRSVGTNPANLNTGAVTGGISGSTLTFASAVPTNIGVGDAIVYNDGSDRLAFIHGRTSSTIFTVKDKDGAAPTAIGAGATITVFRCYTSLRDWEAQTENANITEPTENDVNPPLDLVTGDFQLEVDCYADGADPNRCQISGWTTDATRYIHIRTPTEASEVGTSQRHDGNYSASVGFAMEVVDSDAIDINVEYTRIEGIQAKIFVSSTVNQHCFHEESSIASGNMFFEDLIAVGEITGTGDSCFGIAKNGDGDVFVKNCLVYDFVRSGATNLVGIKSSTGASGKFIIYNCTVQNCRVNFRKQSGTPTYVIKNCISQDAEVNDILQSGSAIDAATSHNVVETASEGAIGATHSTGTATTDTASKLVNTGATFITDGVQVGSIVKNTTDTTYGYVTAVDSETSLSLDSDVFPDGDEGYEVYTNMFGTVVFQDKSGDDFLLSPGDSIAKNQGIDLSADGEQTVTDDIISRSRPQPLSGTFDVGASEVRRRVLVG